MPAGMDSLQTFGQGTGQGMRSAPGRAPTIEILTITLGKRTVRGDAKVGGGIKQQDLRLHVIQRFKVGVMFRFKRGAVKG
ncbi:hypothetical protein GCM10008959_41600 [Deinococcus seoulensis]|uniref:Uncharacterized protein n=1 Tax=Deinococcus seoulensis TaxID=1837379 RepID=A0ABQ2S1I3_9DEIO|nr:hypothetical protein GCM10008959_41600 [Deinococcus seoulensis]